MNRTARSFREDCRRFPQNSKLYSDEVLFDVLTSDAQLRAHSLALSELAVRQMLHPGRYGDEKWSARFDVNRALCDRLGVDALTRFRDECEKCAISSDVEAAVDRAFNCLRASGDSAFVNTIMAAFRPWLEASGLIPVFNAYDAYLLPFKFVKRNSGDPPRVIDAESVEIPEWTGHFRKFADIENISMDVKVDILQKGDVPTRGNSMMLPVLMAWWRKQRVLPRYDVLRFIATGAYEGCELGAVEVKEKESKVTRDVWGGLLLRPGHDRLHGVLPIGIGRDKLLERVCELAEESYDCSPSYAESRLQTFDRMVREQHLGEWKPVTDRLEHLLANVTEKDGEEYLWGLMLRSAAYCHAGQTEKSHEFNAMAKAYASGKSEHQPQLLRLQIEELVILQDEEDFEKVYRLAPDLGKEIEDYAKQEGDSNRAVDLKMRYWGTMGQFWLYDSVKRNDRDLAKQAEHALDEAWKNACGLYKRSCKENGGVAESSAYANCAQDANYRLLRAAFCSRGELRKLASSARNEANSLRSDGADEHGADKNDSFRKRAIALGQYRAVLDGDATMPESEEDESLAEMAKSLNGWVPATTCKYLGAVASWRKDADAARDWFLHADSKLTECRKRIDGQVMRAIHMSVRAEAYRSLRDFPQYSDVAQEMRREALSMFGSNATHPVIGKSDWRIWLETEGSDETYPGRSYWY